jgi:hypothetical protein
MSLQIIQSRNESEVLEENESETLGRQCENVDERRARRRGEGTPRVEIAIKNVQESLPTTYERSR